MRVNQVAWAAALSCVLIGCGTAGGAEPSESQMKDALLDEMNHDVDGTKVTDAVTIKFFKKEACDKPNEQGYRCTFDVQVLSHNIGAGMYNNIPYGVFYQQSGKWAMRPPF